MEDPKTFLYAVRDEAGEITSLTEQLINLKTEIEHKASGLRAITYDGIKVQTTPSDRMPDLLAELEERQRKLTEQISRLQKRRQQAIDMISSLDDSRERQVLMLYFIRCKGRKVRMEKVADKMSYSISRTYEIYSAAIKHLRSKV